MMRRSLMVCFALIAGFALATAGFAQGVADRQPDRHA